MEGMVDGLDRSTMRPLQKDSYLCMAKCCDRCAGAGQAAGQAFLVLHQRHQGTAG